MFVFKLGRAAEAETLCRLLTGSQLPQEVPARGDLLRTGSGLFRPSRVALAVAVLCFIAANLTLAATPSKTSAAVVTNDRWELVWSDEFNGPDGESIDPSKWSFVTGGSGFGNNELESYTNRPSNIHQEKGNLVITARKEDFKGNDGISRSYTSARIESKALFQFQYGRIEARIKIPKGQGLWPAFWMMGSDFDKVGWPICGEVDIMENIGSEPSTVHGSMHGPGYSGGTPLTDSYSLPDPAQFGDDFHIFTLEWEPGAMRFYVDGVLYQTQTVAHLPAGSHWAFDHPFFILLNLAVGGAWPGSPDNSTQFPASMLVDYVRVYRHPDPAANTVKH